MAKKAKPNKPIDSSASEKPKRSYTFRNYPAGSFSDSLELGFQIYANAGLKIRRLTLMEKMNRSPSSGSTRQLITNSAKYGITTGTYNGEWLELTAEGAKIFDERSTERDKTAAKFRLSIESIEPFFTLYNEYVGKRLPVFEVMRDFLDETNVELDDLKECLDLFIVNVKDLGLLRVLGGSETLISIDQALDDLSQQSKIADSPKSTVVSSRPAKPNSTPVTSEKNWESICFIITPIGDENSEQRKHADLFLNSIIEPAIAELGLGVVRADQIGQAGMITSQILEYVTQAKLVIVDLSFLNPNVFYEMAIRHAKKLPVVHMIRKADKIPFDVNQTRCITIDNSDIYTMIPKLQTYRAELATQARKAIEDPDHCGNPITVFYPEFWKTG